MRVFVKMKVNMYFTDFGLSGAGSLMGHQTVVRN